MKTLIAALALLPCLAFAQTEPVRVSLDSRGDDVREVFATLFAQAHKPYALDASIKGRLYVALDRMPFAKALDVVLAQAGLVAKEKDGVTIVSPAPPKPVAPKPVVAPTPAPVASAVPTFDDRAFTRRVTTRLSRAPIGDVFAALGEQTKTEITLDPSVPAYRVDAFFIKTSLRYALDRVCKAAGLKYAIEAGRIVVRA